MCHNRATAFQNTTLQFFDALTDRKCQVFAWINECLYTLHLPRRGKVLCKDLPLLNLLARTSDFPPQLTACRGRPDKRRPASSRYRVSHTLGRDRAPIFEVSPGSITASKSYSTHCFLGSLQCWLLRLTCIGQSGLRSEMIAGTCLKECV